MKTEVIFEDEPSENNDCDNEYDKKTKKFNKNIYFINNLNIEKEIKSKLITYFSEIYADSFFYDLSMESNIYKIKRDNNYLLFDFVNKIEELVNLKEKNVTKENIHNLYYVIEIIRKNFLFYDNVICDLSGINIKDTLKDTEKSVSFFSSYKTFERWMINNIINAASNLVSIHIIIINNKELRKKIYGDTFLN